MVLRALMSARLTIQVNSTCASFPCTKTIFIGLHQQTHAMTAAACFSGMDRGAAPAPGDPYPPRSPRGNQDDLVSLSMQIRQLFNQRFNIIRFRRPVDGPTGCQLTTTLAYNGRNRPALLLPLTDSPAVLPIILRTVSRPAGGHAAIKLPLTAPLQEPAKQNWWCRPAVTAF